MSVSVFISYSHRDETHLGDLSDHLTLLKRSGTIDTWHDRRIGAGEEWKTAIDEQMEKAHVVLLLVSASFLSSNYCWDVEMMRALERHHSRQARIIPVILRPCDWTTAPFAKLQALPKDGKAVTLWPDRDEAWTDVARGIRAAVESLRNFAEPSPRDIALGSTDRGQGDAQPARQRPRPLYPDETTRHLSEQLELSRERKRRLTEVGQTTDPVDAEILDLRRKIREGGQLRPGDALADGRYLLLESLGRGGFATVWKAHDRQRDQDVAIKVLHPQFATDILRRDRFFRGARAMAALKHSGIVRVLDAVGEDGGFFYFVMEFVPGGTLRDAVLRQRPAEGWILSMMLQVARAVAVAHGNGFIHRDIKPANILLAADGTAKLTDFDLVAAADTTGGTRTGALGTFMYAAPEVLDKPQDAAASADVYSLGMTALFCYHGADLPHAVVYDRANFVEKLQCSEPARAVLRRAIQIDCAERFADGAAFCDALATAAEKCRDEAVLDEAALEEIEFFASYGMYLDAFALLEDQLTRWQEHPRLLELKQQIEAKAAAEGIDVFRPHLPAEHAGFLVPTVSGTSSTQASGITTEADWYLGIGGVVFGPLHLTSIREKVVAGVVNEESLVWRDGLVDWEPLKNFPELVEHRSANTSQGA